MLNQSYVNAEQISAFNPNVGTFGSGIPYPMSNLSTNLGFDTKVNSESSNMNMPLVSSLNIRPLPNNMHEKMTSSHAMFLVNTGSNVDEHTAMPIYELNYELEAKSRQLYDPQTGERRNSINRRRTRDDEWYDQFPTTAQEFSQMIKPFGLLDAKLTFAGNLSRSVSGYLGSTGTQRMMATFALQGRKSNVPNFWGQVQHGDEIGFAAVMTNGLFDRFTDPEGSIIDNNPTRVPFLQVIPVLARRGVLRTSIMEYRVTDHSTGRDPLDPLIYKSTLFKELSEHKTQKIDGIDCIDYNVRPNFNNIQKREQITLEEFEIGHYWKLGVVSITNTKVPGLVDIKKALRNYKDYDYLAKHCALTVQLTICGDLGRY